MIEIWSGGVKEILTGEIERWIGEVRKIGGVREIRVKSKIKIMNETG